MATPAPRVVRFANRTAAGREAMTDALAGAAVPSLAAAALAALLEPDPGRKCSAVERLAAEYGRGSVPRGAVPAGALPSLPGRPAEPTLVSPRHVPRRTLRSCLGHAALLHAVAHIEFNAVNLALDCVVRFPAMPEAFARDWAGVAAEEARHFEQVVERLGALGFRYGDFAAHDGLWDMAVRTAHDVLARMALVPRVLEARGLDATPPIIAKLKAAGDDASVAVLEGILRDEIGHVAIGDRWFRLLCAERGLDPEAEYRRLIVTLGAHPPKPPFNRAARLAAGFTERELDALERGT